MNSSEHDLQRVLSGTFSLHVKRMEESQFGRVWASLAVIGAIPMFFLTGQEQRLSLVCVAVALAIWSAFSWYVYSSHKSFARALYFELKRTGYEIRRGGLCGPGFEVRAVGVLPDDEASGEIERLIA